MLSPLHKRALLSTFLHIENRLSEMEPLLVQRKRPSPLSQHVNDLSPDEAKSVEDCFARIRSTMLACLEKHGIPLEGRRVSVRWALQTTMQSLSIALADLGRGRLRCYGELDDAERQDMQSIQHDLDRLGTLVDKVTAICGR